MALSVFFLALFITVRPNESSLLDSLGRTIYIKKISQSFLGYAKWITRLALGKSLAGVKINAIQ